MNRELWLIWRQPDKRRRYKIGLLSYNGSYTFKYVNPELDEALEDGFLFFPGFENLDKTYKSEKLFANVETRLPNSKRPDYLEILNIYGLNKNSSLFEILKATKGRLITDNYEFVPVFDKDKIEFDVAGTKYAEDLKECCKYIHINNKLKLVLDGNNEYDKYAIKVYLPCNNKDYFLGYVPRYYSKELTELLSKDMPYSAMVESLNFESEISDEDITVVVKLIFNT
mgnify:CR=1 FL=1